MAEGDSKVKDPLPPGFYRYEIEAAGRVRDGRILVISPDTTVEAFKSFVARAHFPGSQLPVDRFVFERFTP